MSRIRSVRHKAGLLTTGLNLVAIVSVLLSTGCATPEPPRQHDRPDVIATMPGPHPPDVIPAISISDSTATLRNVVPDDVTRDSAVVPGRDECACTLEHRVNLCVTINGTETFSDAYAGVAFARVREGGRGDTLSAADVAGGGRCFGEWRGVQRVLMLRDTAVADSSEWFEIRTVDCCHGEARTVDFVVK